MNGDASQYTRSVAPSRRKEKHVSRACNSCRRKKSKCDGMQPVCGTCTGTQIECTWTTEEDGRRPATKAQVDAMSMEIRTLKTDKERQAAEIERLRAEVARLSGGAASPDSASAPAHTRHSSLSIQIPRPASRPGHAHALSTDSFLHAPGSPAAALAHSPGSVTSSLPSPMPNSSHFLTVPNYGYRGTSPDGSIYSSTDEDEPPRSAVSDSDGEAGGILPSFTSTEKKLAISDDSDGLLAVGGASPLALTCSPPHTPSRSRASSFRGSFSSVARPTLAGFRFPPSSAAPTPHNSLSSPTAETELEHSPQCPCEWARYLPPGLGLSRDEHDSALTNYFNFGAGWGMRVVRHKFLRDMRSALSTPADQPLPPTAHWSPALHCAVLADAAAYAPAGSALRMGAPMLASAARDHADNECTKESGVVAAVQALAVLARYHLGFPKGARLAYARFGMAVRVAVAAGLNMDCAEWVRLGRIDEEEKWDRDWCFFTLLVQDVDMSLHVGQDLSVPAPPSSLRPPQLAAANAPADGGVHDVFLVTVSLMRLAARMMQALQAPNPDASEVSGVQSALARWHADLPDALQWHRTSSTSAAPHVIVLHMAHWWITIMLHRPFYVGRAALDESVKFIDDAARKILRAIGTYERLYTLARVPLSVTQMAFAAGAAALLRADAAQPGAMKKRREALEACTAAVNALRAMGAAWPCAAGYADALENRMAQVGRPRAIHSPSPSYASSSAHGHSLSLSVPSVVVHNNDDGGLASQMGNMFNMFGGPGVFADGSHSPFIPGSPAAQMPMDFGAGAGDASGSGLGLWAGDAGGGGALQPDAMMDMYASPTASQDSAAPSGYATFQSSPTQQQDGFSFQASPTGFQSSPTQQQDGFVFTPQNNASPTGQPQQDGFVFQHSPSPSQDYLQTHAHTGSQGGGQQGFGGVGVSAGWPQGTSPSGWSQ